VWPAIVGEFVTDMDIAVAIASAVNLAAKPAWCLATATAASGEVDGSRQQPPQDSM
jgi:hypothetical protein